MKLPEALPPASGLRQPRPCPLGGAAGPYPETGRCLSRLGSPATTPPRWRYLAQVLSVPLVCSTWALPIHAQDPHPQTLEPPATTVWEPLSGQAAVGRIDVTNNLYGAGWGGADDTSEVSVETPFGAIVFTVVSTWNASCAPIACPDTYEVRSVPEGFLIIPGSAEIEEEATGSFLLYRDIFS